MVATPVLAGALLRVLAGVLVDRLEPEADRRAHARCSSSPGCRSPGCSACTASPRCCWSAACSASPARPSRSPCRSPRAGIRRSTRARRSASPAPAIPAPCSPRCSPRRWPPAFGWNERVRPGRDPAGRSRSRVYLVLAKDSADAPAAEAAGANTSACCSDRRRLVVHVLLRRHLRRLRRPGLLADDLLQRRSTA